MTKFKENYYNKIPEDLEALIKSLGHINRLKIIFTLREKGDLSFSEINEWVKLNKSLLTNHIKKLELSGVVQNYFKVKNDTANYSFYKLTPLGKKLINDLVSTYRDYHQGLNKDSINLYVDFKEEIPEDFLYVLSKLKNRFRFSLSILLSDYENLSFSDIVEKTKKESSVIANHLKKLELGGLIQNFLMKSDTSNEYSYYRLTKLGNLMIHAIIKSYNEYFHESLFTIKNEINTELNLEFFNAGCSTWALPNEMMLGWIELYSEKIYSLKIELSKNLILDNIFITNIVSEKSNKFYIVDIKDLETNYLSFQFYSLIPDGKLSAYRESIKLIVLDKDLNELSQKELEITILKPIIKLDVTNRQIESNSGVFELKISILKGFRILIPGIEIKVLDENGNKIEIKTKKADASELNPDIPPEINPENLIGGIRINYKGNLNFFFRIPYIDLNGNKYYSNEAKVQITNDQGYLGNFNYTFDSSKILTEI
ncbi:MAG: ArsR family transcriptional regulator [Promethearchaeota archaeon]|nr:MAG: ArsR family transcriptional regulator [Candidatus Lokiarchaeota archaeon]